MKKRGFSLIETIISLIVILTVIIPTYIIVLKIYKNINLLKKKEKIENYYMKVTKILKKDIFYEISDKKYKLYLERKLIEEKLYKIDILIEDKELNIKKQGVIYVYKQK